MLQRPPNSLPIVRVALGIVLHRESLAWHLLITQRQSNTHLAGWWEFPGGKINQHESPAQCVVRELKEEVTLNVKPIHPLKIVQHTYDNIHVVLHPWLCKRTAGQVQLRNVAAYQWINPQALANIAFPPANKSIVQEIDSLYTQGNLLTPLSK